MRTIVAGIPGHAVRPVLVARRHAPRLDVGERAVPLGGRRRGIRAGRHTATVWRRPGAVNAAPRRRREAARRVLGAAGAARPALGSARRAVGRNGGRMLLVIVCGALLAVAVALCVVWGREPLVEPEIPGPPTSADREPDDLTREPPPRRTPPLRLVGLDVPGRRHRLGPPGHGGRRATRHAAARRHLARGDRPAHGGAGDGRGDHVRGHDRLPRVRRPAVRVRVDRAVPARGTVAPPGRLAGPTFGLAAFIMVAPFIDPLRADNVDFDIVGPGWLSVLVFAALAVVQGAFLAAFAGPVEPEPPAHDAGELARHRPAPAAGGRAGPPRRGPRRSERSSRSRFPASCPGSSASAPHVAG